MTIRGWRISGGIGCIVNWRHWAVGVFVTRWREDEILPSGDRLRSAEMYVLLGPVIRCLAVSKRYSLTPLP